jgi:hypothetical protein
MNKEIKQKRFRNNRKRFRNVKITAE